MPVATITDAPPWTAAASCDFRGAPVQLAARPAPAGRLDALAAGAEDGAADTPGLAPGAAVHPAMTAAAAAAPAAAAVIRWRGCRRLLWNGPIVVSRAWVWTGAHTGTARPPGR